MPVSAKVAPIALAALVAASPAKAIDEFFPTFGNDGYDVLHYDLDLGVTTTPHRLDARARIRIKAEQRLSSFTLDLAGLTVNSVKIDGASAAFAQEGDKLRITPSSPISKRSKFLVDIAYSGTPAPIQDPTVPDDPSYRLGWFKYQDATYALSEPVGASTFYPANDEPTDKATFRITVTVPTPYTAVANGVLKREQTLGNRKRFVWEMHEPMTTWLATVHVNTFTLTKARSADGTPLRIYSTAATPAEDVAGYVAAKDMIPFFERLVGRYPFAGYGSVVVDDPILYYALETQAMSTFPVGAADEDIVAHELAHQWFGNSVSIAAWEDLWFAEGAATFFEILWPNRASAADFDAAMLDLYDYVVQEQIGPAVVEAPEEMFTDRTYLRGAATLYALKRKVGDRKFYLTLRAFTQIYRGKNITSQDFIDFAVWVSRDRSVRPLLEAWLYDEAVPALPGLTARAARKGTVPAPDVVGLRCGRGAHRGAAASCAAGK